MLNTNMLVDATVSHSVFSSMGNFNDYHQIKMDPLDGEKTDLQTLMVNFYYTVMLFSLQSTSATYQCTLIAYFMTCYMVAWKTR